MSWAETGKINSNFQKPLNEQMRELSYNGAYLFTTPATFTPDKTGWYKVIVVGQGGTIYDTSGDTYNSVYTGGAGGVAIKTQKLSRDSSYKISITSSYSKFGDELIANSGSDAEYDVAGEGGSASGGDFNYSGNNGMRVYSRNMPKYGADTGVFIPSLMQRLEKIETQDGETHVAKSGLGVLGYGGAAGVDYYITGSGSTYYNWITSPVGEGAVIIIPLELE